VVALDRTAKALEMRMQGLSYDEIARKLGYANRSGAYKAVCTLLAERAKQANDDADQLLVLELARLDRMLVYAEKRAKKGDPQAIRAALAVSERRAKLLGMDAPTKADVNMNLGDVQALSDEELKEQMRVAYEQIAAKVDAKKPKTAEPEST
jgi:DNA-directed RNA polymerase subunit K/omega